MTTATNYTVARRRTESADGSVRKPCTAWAWKLDENGNPTNEREYCAYTGTGKGNSGSTHSPFSCTLAGDGITNTEYRRRRVAWDNR